MSDYWRRVKRGMVIIAGLALAAAAWSQAKSTAEKTTSGADDYESSEQISADLPVTFPVDI